MIKTTRTKQIGAMNTSGSTSEQAMNSSFMKFSMLADSPAGRRTGRILPESFRRDCALLHVAQKSSLLGA